MKLWEILQHTTQIVSRPNSGRCFLVCTSLIRISGIIAAERLVEQTWWIIELGLDKHGSWLKTHCDSIKSSTNTNQQSWQEWKTQDADRKLVGSDNRALGDTTFSISLLRFKHSNGPIVILISKVLSIRVLFLTYDSFVYTQQHWLHISITWRKKTIQP